MLKTPLAESAFERVLAIAASDPRSFAVDEAASCFELSTGRCRMKLLQPRPGADRLCAFFYKRSNLAWSQDRFSYGGVEFRLEQLTDPAIRSWLAWLKSGFDPSARPNRIRRAFLYDIPE